MTSQTIRRATTAICTEALTPLIRGKTGTALPVLARHKRTSPITTVPFESTCKSGIVIKSLLRNGSRACLSSAMPTGVTARLHRTAGHLATAQPSWHRSQRGLADIRAVRHDLRLPRRSWVFRGTSKASYSSSIPKRSFQYWVQHTRNRNGSPPYRHLGKSVASRFHFLKGVSLLNVCQKSDGFLLGSARANTCCWGTLVGTVTWRWWRGCKLWCGGATGHPL